MNELRSRRAVMKVVGASAAGLALGTIWAVPASAAIFNVRSVLDFTNTTLDHLTIKADLDGITKSADPNDFEITVNVKNLKTAEEEIWVGHPTIVR
jgi:hypothetical protein